MEEKNRLMKDKCLAALDELGAVFRRLDNQALAAVVDAVLAASKIVVYGVGREGLQMRGFAMRLFHLGLDVAVVGDMTAPHVGQGDLLIASAGPGHFATVSALLGVASAAGAKTVVVTAQPSGESAKAADLLLIIPAQTMADDLSASVGVLPMGSVYEGAQFIVFEMIVVAVRDRLGLSVDAMRARHTNLE